MVSLHFSNSLSVKSEFETNSNRYTLSDVPFLQQKIQTDNHKGTYNMMTQPIQGYPTILFKSSVWKGPESQGFFTPHTYCILYNKIFKPSQVSY